MGKQVLTVFHMEEQEEAVKTNLLISLLLLTQREWVPSYSGVAASNLLRQSKQGFASDAVRSFFVGLCQQELSLG